MKKAESKIQIVIRKGLQQLIGGFWIKIHGGPFQQKGMPDLLGCVQGLYITVEVKLPDDKKSKLKPHQKLILRRIKKHGGCAITARSLEEAYNKIGAWLYEQGYTKRQAIFSAEDSRQIVIQKKKIRFIHGAGNWQNSDFFTGDSLGKYKGRVNKSINRLS